MRPDLAGHYFWILSSAALIELIIDIATELEPPLFYIGILIYPLVADDLLRGKRTTWFLAVALCLLGYAYGVLVSLKSTDGRFLELALALSEITFWGIPLILLLLPSTRRAFRGEGFEWSRGRIPWTRNRVLVYLTLGCAMAGGEAAFDATIRTTTTNELSWPVGLQNPAYRFGAYSRARWVEEEGSGKGLYFAWWILGEPGNNMSLREDTIHLGDVPVPVPPTPTAHYVIEPPKPPANEPNIFMVYDGQLVVVSRRVTLATFPAARQAIQGSADLAEVKRRLENLLPPLDAPTP